MKQHAVFAVLLTIPLAWGQGSKIPRMPDQRPDFQGVWDHPYVSDMSRDAKDQKGAGPLPFFCFTAAKFGPIKRLHNNSCNFLSRRV